MRTLVIITAVVLMIAGAGISVMKTLGVGPFGPDRATSEYAPASIGDSGSPKGATPRFIDMEPIIVTIFVAERVATTIQIAVKLEAIGSNNEARITRNMTRLQDRYLRGLYSYIPRLLRNKERVDVYAIKRRLQLISDKVLGPGTISAVLVQSVVDSSRPGASPK
jgi:flagellar basal body-associated protein FliL